MFYRGLAYSNTSAANIIRDYTVKIMTFITKLRHSKLMKMVKRN